MRVKQKTSGVRIQTENQQHLNKMKTKANTVRWTILALMVISLFLLISLMTGCKKVDCFEENSNIRMKYDAKAEPYLDCIPNPNNCIWDMNEVKNQLKKLDEQAKKELEVDYECCCWENRYEHIWGQ